VYVRAGPYRRKITIAVGCFGVLYVSSIPLGISLESLKIKKIIFFITFFFRKKVFKKIKKVFVEYYILENLSPCRAETKTMSKDGSGHTEAKSPSP
jgi:hypothetical protein